MPSDLLDLPDHLIRESPRIVVPRHDLHKVAVDNTRDRGWPKLREFLDGYTTYPRIPLGTCTGMDLIYMSNSPAPVSGRNGQPPAREG